MTPKENVKAQIDAEHYEELRRLAERNERSISAEVRIAIRVHLETHRAAA